MSDAQRRLILIASIVIALLQFVVGFRGFMDGSGGDNLILILPAPLASLGIGLFIWMGRGKGGGGSGKPRGRIMRGPWR